MVTRNDVIKTLEGVRDPELGGNIVELGMVSDVVIAGTSVEVGIARRRLLNAHCETRSRTTPNAGCRPCRAWITSMCEPQR